jgi:hypothetical protein
VVLLRQAAAPAHLEFRAKFDKWRCALSIRTPSFSRHQQGSKRESHQRIAQEHCQYFLLEGLLTRCMVVRDVRPSRAALSNDRFCRPRAIGIWWATSRHLESRQAGFDLAHIFSRYAKRFCNLIFDKTFKERCFYAVLSNF